LTCFACIGSGRRLDVESRVAVEAVEVDWVEGGIDVYGEDGTKREEVLNLDCWVPGTTEESE
jgi:hypothetical protein